MEKIIIDSANFFDMLHYDYIFQNYGIATLQDTLNNHKKILEGQKQVLLNLFSEEYKQTYEGQEFYKLKDYYPTYAENQIDKFVMVEIGLLEFENQTFSDVFGPENETTLSKFAELEEAKQNVKNLEQHLKEYNIEKSLYDCFSQIVYAGEIFEKIIHGKYKIYITYSTLYEIACCVSKIEDIQLQKQAENFLQACTVIGIKNKKLCGGVDEIAQKFRTPKEQENLPYNQRNFMLPYLVAVNFAEANLAGINILSQDV